MTVKEIQIQNSPHREHRQSRRECEKGGKIRKENITDSSKQNTASKSLLILTSHQRVFHTILHPSPPETEERRLRSVTVCVPKSKVVFYVKSLFCSLSENPQTPYIFSLAALGSLQRRKSEKNFYFLYIFSSVFFARWKVREIVRIRAESEWTHPDS